MVTSTLTILNDLEGEYEDDIRYRREKNEHVSGPLGADPLLRGTVRLLNRWVAAYDHCGRDELTLLGRCLYAIAFGGSSAPSPLRRAFEDSYELHRKSLRDTPFRLRLDIRREAGELGRYPWEFLFMPRPEGGFFLAGQQTELILTRYIRNSDVVPPGDDPSPMRILVVLSRPRSRGLARVRADSLIEAVQKLRSYTTEVEVLDSPTRTELRRSIVERPTHIIHFIGHGRAGAIALKKEEDQLLADRGELLARRAQGELVDEVDEADWADGMSVRTLLRSGLDGSSGTGPRGRLIFLHACEGASPPAVEDSLLTFNSIARDLADGERVAAVVAMQYAIGIEDAERFAVSFYEGLQSGAPLDQAVSRARCALGELPGPGRQSWDHRCFGTPVIYIRQESAFFRYSALRRGPGRDNGYAHAGPAMPVARVPCPNPQCGHEVIIGQTRCHKCQSVIMGCPVDGCDGMVMTAPGSECTAGDYRVPTRGELAPGDNSAQRKASSDTRFDTPRPLTPHQQEERTEGRGLRTAHLHVGGERALGYRENPDEDASHWEG